jgi:hypothetical protein
MTRHRLTTTLGLAAIGALAAAPAQAGIGGFFVSWLTVLTVAVAGLFLYIRNLKK